MHKIKYLTLLTLLLSVTLTSCMPTWKTLRSERDRVTGEVNNLKPRLPQAFDEVSRESGKYPQHYLTDQNILGRLDAADRSLAAITAPETGWLAKLNAAIENKDKKKAKEALGEIDSRTPEIQAIIELVFGPPEDPSQGLFKQLDAKVALLKGGALFDEVKALDVPTWVSLQAAQPFPLCGSTTQMSYSSARSSYGSAVTYLMEAERLNTTMVDGMIDLPAVSDALVNAKASFNAAVTSIGTAVWDHQSAVSAIGEANIAKADADNARSSFFNLLAYYRDESNTEYDDGVKDLESANKSCLGEQFDQAQTDADNARDHFEESKYQVERSAPDNDPIIISGGDGGDTDTSPIDLFPSDSGGSDPFFDSGSDPGGDPFFDSSSDPGGDDFFDYGSDSGGDDFFDD